MIHNYELGVLLLPPNFVEQYNEEKVKEEQSIHHFINTKNFCEPIEFPFAIPFHPYVKGIDKPFVYDSEVISVDSSDSEEESDFNLFCLWAQQREYTHKYIHKQFI